MTNSPAREVLIACVGNGLAGDDGAGEAVYECLRRELPSESTDLVHLGLGGMALYDYFNGQRLLIVVDAVQLNAAPGRVHVLNWNDLPATTGQAVSLHGVGLSEALSAGQLLCPELVPKHTILIGIEGRRFNELGVPLSPAVADAIAVAVKEVKRQVNCTQGAEAIS